MRIIKAIQNCWACPSQWDAWTETGQYIYLRYRGGHGYAKMYEDEDWWKKEDLEQGTVIADFVYGHPLDGCISLEDFCLHAGIELDLEQ